MSVRCGQMSTPHIQTNLGASNVFNVFGEARGLDLPRLEVEMRGQDVYFVNLGSLSLSPPQPAPARRDHKACCASVSI